MSKKDHLKKKQNKTLMDKVKSRFARRAVTVRESQQPSDVPSVAAALGELMAPYLRADMSVRQRQVALAIAVMAWNCSLLTEEEALKGIRAVQENLEPAERGELVEIMAAMQVRKEELFPWGIQTILDATLDPHDATTLRLSVVLSPSKE
jgi:hypothetical protein